MTEPSVKQIRRSSCLGSCGIILLVIILFAVGLTIYANLFTGKYTYNSKGQDQFKITYSKKMVVSDGKRNDWCADFIWFKPLSAKFIPIGDAWSAVSAAVKIVWNNRTCNQRYSVNDYFYKDISSYVNARKDEARKNGVSNLSVTPTSQKIGDNIFYQIQEDKDEEYILFRPDYTAYINVYGSLGRSILGNIKF